MPVKHKPLIPSESESEGESLPTQHRSERVCKSSSSKANSMLSSKNNNNHANTTTNRNGSTNNSSDKDCCKETPKEANTDYISKSKYASYSYSESKDDRDVEASRMLYRTDSNEDIGDDDPEEPGLFGYCQECFHPKIRKHWKTFVASIALFVAGIAFLSAATVIAVMPAKEDGSEPHSYVFFICGLICLIPGVYYVIYICRAAKGEKGYNLENIPTFSN